METLPNSIRPFPTNTAGLNTYQAAMAHLTGSLLSLYGSQNASIPGAQALNPSQGKTPAAIEMYSGKEATRDGAERQQLELSLEQLIDGFFSLIVNIGTEAIPVQLFAKDIENIVKAGLTDVVGLFSSGFASDYTRTAGDLTINPEALQGVEYRFNVTPNSTVKLEKEKQLQSLDNLMGMVGKFQNIFKDDPRIDINWGRMLEAYEELSMIPGASEFVTIKNGPSPQELQQMQQAKQLALEQQKIEQEALLKEQQMNPQQGQPMVNRGGVFQNPVLGQAADVISKM